MIYKDLYRKFEDQIGSKKKFHNMPPTERESTLKIAGVIAKVVDVKNIEIEARDCDIFFEDHDEYYIEVKTPQFFKGDRGDDLSRTLSKFWDELKTYKSNTLLGGFVKPNNKLEIRSFTLNERSEKPKGLIEMDSKYIPDEDVFRHLYSLLEKAAGQLENIKNGRKIAIIDLTYLFKANLATEKILFELVKDGDILERIDAVSLCYHNQLLNSTDQLPFTIGPTVIRKSTVTRGPWRHISKVFDHPHWGYSGNLIITTPNLIKELDESLEVPKLGGFNLIKADRKLFFETLEQFDQLDSEERNFNHERLFTHFQEKKYDLKRREK